MAVGDQRAGGRPGTWVRSPAVWRGVGATGAGFDQTRLPGPRRRELGKAGTFVAEVLTVAKDRPDVPAVIRAWQPETGLLLTVLTDQTRSAWVPALPVGILAMSSSLAAASIFGLSVVWMVSPPRLIVRLRSSRVVPTACSCPS